MRFFRLLLTLLCLAFVNPVWAATGSTFGTTPVLSATTTTVLSKATTTTVSSKATTTTVSSKTTTTTTSGKATTTTRGLFPITTTTRGGLIGVTTTTRTTTTTLAAAALSGGVIPNGIMSNDVAVFTYNVWAAGGHPHLVGSHVHDIKGQVVIGVSTGGGNRVEFGGIYGALAEAGGDIVVPEGTVLLNIRRDGADIVVEWSGSADIYMQIGNGSGLFANGVGPAPWLGPLTGTEEGIVLSPGQLRHIGEAGAPGDLPEVYYKAVKPGRSDRRRAAYAVGKIRYHLFPGNTFIGIPFQWSGTVDELMQPQIHGYPAGCRIYSQNDARNAFNASDFNGSVWSDTIDILPEEGYYFYNTGTSGFSIVLCGRLLTDEVAVTMGAGSTLFSMQFPSTYSFSVLGSGTVPGDRLLIYNNAASPVPGFTSINQDDFDTTSYSLNGLDSYYYYRDPTAGDLTWSPTLP
ncbi:MAG: hypothetical protein JW782_01115 [Candidatus Saganbacteria bacterium]|nr:hypothetical protein [Candidatus Saganbacteria bacterium]